MVSGTCRVPGFRPSPLSHSVSTAPPVMVSCHHSVLIYFYFCSFIGFNWIGFIAVILLSRSLLQLPKKAQKRFRKAWTHPTAGPPGQTWHVLAVQGPHIRWHVLAKAALWVAMTLRKQDLTTGPPTPCRVSWEIGHGPGMRSARFLHCSGACLSFLTAWQWVLGSGIGLLETNHDLLEQGE